MRGALRLLGKTFSRLNRHNETTPQPVLNKDPSGIEKDLTRKLRIERATLARVRTAASVMVNLPALADQQCIACGGQQEQISVGRYPAYSSGFFAGLIFAQCNHCGLGWVPVPNLDLDNYYTNQYAHEVRPERAYKGKFYDSENPIWAREKHRPRDRAMRHVRDITRFGPFERVMDIGAGEGIFLKNIEAREKYAWELDVHSIQILTQELGVTLLQLDARENFFDLLQSSHSLEHFTYDSLKEMLDKAFRALRAGGLFHIEVPIGAQQLENLIAGSLPERPALEPHTLFFSSYALNRLLVASGFEILETVVCPWTRSHLSGLDLDSVLKGAKKRKTAVPMVMIARKPDYNTT